MLKCINLKHSLCSLNSPLKFRSSHLPLLSTFHQFSLNTCSSHSNTNLQDDIFATIDRLSACITTGQISAARSLFANLFEPNTRLLNHTFKELSNGGFFKKIIDLHFLLRLSNAKADNFTYPFVLKACAALNALDEAKLVHTQVVKSGFEHHVIVANSLIDVYSKLGCPESAHEVFDGMPDRNLVSWNCIISGYALNGFPDTALEYYISMQFEGMREDKVTLKIILPACSLLRACYLGEAVHGHVILLGFSLDTVVQTAVMDMYAKCGIMATAQKLFEDIHHRDAVTWNALIGGYLQQGQLDMVLQSSFKMHADNVKYTVVTLLTLLQTCADAAILQTGKAIHGHIIKLGFSSDAPVGVLLIKLYSKCGKLDFAFRIFRTMTTKNVHSWSAIICGLGMHGYGEAALMSFFTMLKRGIFPDTVCFLIVLSSCSHNGMVCEGFKVFHYMVRHFGIEPTLEHYATLVDLIGRAGFIDEAHQFIAQMPVEPDISVWGAVLGACKIHGSFGMRRPEEKMVALDPKTAGYYKLLLSMQASKGEWGEVLESRGLIESRGVERIRGHSLIEVIG